MPHQFSLLARYFLILTVSFISLVASGQVLETLYSFHRFDGANPQCGIIEGTNGFFGTTYYGGTNNLGTIFKLLTNGTLITLCEFNGTNGQYPAGELLFGKDGNLYGVTDQGGTSNAGTVFKMTVDGQLTTLASFTNSNGANPSAGLVQANDGNFYGTTVRGGTYNRGTVYRMDSQGTLTSLVTFDGTNGANPYGGLIQGNDSLLYGTTRYWFLAENTIGLPSGTVFNMATNGELTTLFRFSGENGSFPMGELIQNGDGEFMGTTQEGGTGHGGTVFRMSTSNDFTTLASFNVVNGYYPETALLPMGGSFYGAAQQGGNFNKGTVFQLNPNQELVALVNFNKTNGAYPTGNLTLGKDGNLYGTTFSGGAGTNNLGTIYRISPLLLNSRQSGNQFILSWSTNAVGFKLQSTIDFNPFYQWIDSTNPVVVGGQFTVTNTISGSGQFFRLKK